MALATLSIDLVAQLGKLTGDLDKATRLNEKAAADIERRWKGMEAAAGSVGTAIGAALAGGWAVNFTRDTLEAIDALNDVKDATGASIENLSALEDIGLRTGTNMQTIGDALARMNKVLNEAGKGTPMAQALERIGLQAAELRKADPAEAIKTIADALAGFADDGDKARYVQDLFGKSAREIAPFLHDLADAQGLAAKRTTEQAEEVDKLKKQLAGLSANFTQVSRSILLDALPALNGWLEKVQGAQQYGLDLFKNEVKAASQSDKLADIVHQIEKVNNALQASPNNTALQTRLAELRKEYAETSKAAADAADRIKGLANAAKPMVGDGRGLTVPTTPKPSLGPAPDKPEKVKTIRETVTEYERLMQRLRERLDIGQKEIELGRTLTQGERDRIKAMEELQAILKRDKTANGEKARALIDQVFAIEQLQEAEARRVKVSKDVQDALAKAADAWRVEKEAMKESVQAIHDQVIEYGLSESSLRSLTLTRMDHVIALEREALAEKQREARGASLSADRERIALLEQQRDALARLGALKDLHASDAFAGASDALRQYMEEIRNLGDTTRATVEGSLKGLEDRLTDFFVTGKADWQSYVEYILAQLARITIVQPMVNSLAGYFSGGGGFSGNGTQAMGTSLGGLGLSGGRMIGDGPLYGAPSKQPTKSVVVNVTSSNTFGSNVSRAEIQDYVTARDAKLKADIARSIKVGDAKR